MLTPGPLRVKIIPMRLHHQLLLSAGVVGAFLLTSGCSLYHARWEPIRPSRGARSKEYVLEVTGYCSCGECCGYRRNWLGRPVISSGPQRGKPKKIGLTASGVRARSGTIAADTALFPFGTVMYVPGYGYGRVEDRGGAIRGHRIDLYFATHRQAMEWGRKKKRVTVWLPRR